MATREESELQQVYRDRYAAAVVAADLAAERAALGSDYAATGFTTRAQAERLVPLLRLRTGSLLLDVGSGCGWPGLYLAKRAGCRVVAADLTVDGMRRAAGRAAEDGMAARTAVAVASARRLPFRPESFDAIVQADVLC